MTYICLGRKVSKVEKFRFLQTCRSYNESATVSFKVSFQFLILVVSRTLVVLVCYNTVIFYMYGLCHSTVAFMYTFGVPCDGAYDPFMFVFRQRLPNAP